MPLHRPDVRGTAAFGALLAAAGAALAYAAHHAPTFDGHGWSTLLTIVLAAALTGTVVARAARADVKPLVVARTSALVVRPLEPRDLPAVARLHGEALPHGFLARLGQRFLRAYDATFADSPHAIALVADVGGHPLGFILGVLDPVSHRAWLRRERRARLAVLGFLGLAARPGVAVHFARTRMTRYARAWRGAPGGVTDGTRLQPVAVLSHIAVEEGGRGLGAGRVLVDAFVAAARAAGASEARLLTAKADEGASAFYRRLGWAHRGTRAADGSSPRMDELALRLPECR
jgi:ribosomal protein S18 acetylase RimI-like enzyme